MEESGWNIIRNFPFNASFNNVSLAFGPGHDDDLLSLLNSINSHSDSSLGHIINAFKRLGRIPPGQSMQINQPSMTINR